MSVRSIEDQICDIAKSGFYADVSVAELYFYRAILPNWQWKAEKVLNVSIGNSADELELNEPALKVLHFFGRAVGGVDMPGMKTKRGPRLSTNGGCVWIPKRLVAAACGYKSESGIRRGLDRLRNKGDNRVLLTAKLCHLMFHQDGVALDGVFGSQLQLTLYPLQQHIDASGHGRVVRCYIADAVARQEEWCGSVIRESVSGAPVANQQHAMRGAI